MYSFSKAVSINEHFERLVQKLDLPPILFYPKNLPKQRRGRAKSKLKYLMSLMTKHIVKHKNIRNTRYGD
jgi:hypothetical protein